MILATIVFDKTFWFVTIFGLTIAGYLFVSTIINDIKRHRKLKSDKELNDLDEDIRI